MKILFIDDEPLVLEGLERMLFDLADEWDMTFVGSGAEAFQELERESYDVVVSDMRMPEMDGVAVLREMHRRFPEITRIILSGHAEEGAALCVVPFAHQFLSKPCKAEVLQEVIERTHSLQVLLRDETVRATVGQIDRLPPVPQVYTALTKVLANQEASAEDVAEIIKQDTAMCAKILQLVNSAFFSRGIPSTDICQAVTRLGFQLVKDLTLSAEVFRTPELPIQVDGFSLEALQRHAFHAATIASKLLTDRKQAAEAFMAGMLHDVGKLIMATELPDKLEAALTLAAAQEQSLYAAESQLHGVSHAEIGAYLLGLWGLPPSIIEAVASHHEPTRVPHQTGFGVVAAVHVANCLSSGAEMDMDYLTRLGVADQVETWRDMAAELAEN